jgi:hypothetical protein
MPDALKTLCSLSYCHNLVINSRNPQEKTGASSAESGPSRKICEATGKIPYATAAKAWRVIQHLGDRSRNRKVYRCSPCDHWHIGTWQKKPDARRAVADRDGWEARG